MYHFPETLRLAQTASETYLAELHTYTPPGVKTTEEFEAKYGKELWKTDEDAYDYLVKVEPAQRAYQELGVKAVITGRRRSQGADRQDLPVVEVDSTGLVKINPLIDWSFKDVRDYIDKEYVLFESRLPGLAAHLACFAGTYHTTNFWTRGTAPWVTGTRQPHRPKGTSRMPMSVADDGKGVTRASVACTRTISK